MGCSISLGTTVWNSPLRGSVDHGHPEPLWKSKADFVFGARLPEPGHSEQLWGRRLTERNFEVCCVPLFVYGVALGDVVEVDDDFNFVRVVEPSGRLVLRVYGDEERVATVAGQLRELGCGIEAAASRRLIGVDCDSLAIFEGATALLTELEDEGALEYESGQ